MNKLPHCLLSLSLSACATAPTLGGSDNVVATGSAAGQATANASSQIEHCDKTLGTLGIEEDQSAPWYGHLSRYQLPSTVPLLRLIVQQSNCFVIVERGHSLNTLRQERSLADSGEARAGSNMGKGQMAAADYTMSPTINFSEQGTSGGGGALGGLVPGGLGTLVGFAAANYKANEASTVLLLIDNRSSVQLSASQGSAKNWDIGGLGGVFGVGGGATAGGYSNTPQGKIISAAFMDSYNQMVRGLRTYKAQTVEGGLGTGGTLGVDGGTTPASRKLSGDTAKPAKKTAAKKQ